LMVETSYACRFGAQELMVDRKDAQRSQQKLRRVSCISFSL
jgi:hypothetical protein